MKGDAAPAGSGSPDHAVNTTLKVLDRLLGESSASAVEVRLWEGTTWRGASGSDSESRVTVVLKDPGALREVLLKPNSLSLGELYIHDRVDVEGDLEHLLEVGEQLLAKGIGIADRISVAKTLVSLPRRNARVGSTASRCQPARLSGNAHSKTRDREAVTYHYDLSNEFYQLFLDERMTYSCAYFEHPDQRLDEAQIAKLDYICRKLRLQPGDRLLDIGCGWGGLVMHAAREYGADTTGITLSSRQAELANEWIARARLSDRCRVLIADYRDIDEPESYDRLASVGMFEHVGHALLPEYFERAYRLLRPGGAFLNHGIADNLTRVVQGRPVFEDEEPGFSDRYVFPDGELVPLHVTLDAAEHAGFEVRDVESLREHYAHTLRRWVKNLEEHHQEAVRAVDETAYRIWRLFMAASAYGFSVGNISVYQTLLVKPDGGDSRLPLRRDDWYAKAEALD